MLAPGAPLPDHEPFDVLLCLQGCAQANDYAIAAGAARGIPVVLNPCCYSMPQSASSAPSAVATASSNTSEGTAPSGEAPVRSPCVPRSRWLCNCKPSISGAASSSTASFEETLATNGAVNEGSTAPEWGSGLAALGTHGYRSCAADSSSSGKVAATAGAANSLDVTTAITRASAALTASQDGAAPPVSSYGGSGSVASALWGAGCRRAVCDLSALPKAAEAGSPIQQQSVPSNNGGAVVDETSHALSSAISGAEVAAAETTARLVLAADLCARAREEHGCATVWAPVTTRTSTAAPVAAVEMSKEAANESMVPTQALEGVLVVVAPQPSWAAFNDHRGSETNEIEGSSSSGDGSSHSWSKDVAAASAAMSHALASAVQAPVPSTTMERASHRVTSNGKNNNNTDSAPSAAPLPILPAAYHVVLAHGNGSATANTYTNSGKNRLEGMGALLPAFTVDEGGGLTGSSHALSGSQGGAGCTHFVKRKQRLCTRMATVGSVFCAEHQPEALAASRAASKALLDSNGAKKEARAVNSSTSGSAEDSGANAAGRDNDSGGDAKRPRQGDTSSSNNSRPGGRISSTQRRMANPFSRRNLEMNQTGSDEEGNEQNGSGDGQEDTSISSGKKTSSNKTNHNNNNPLLAAALAPGGWARVFDDPSLPLLVDIGCARGACVRKLAAKHPNWNFLGLEIRPQLVDDAVAETQRQLLLASTTASSSSSAKTASSNDASATHDSAPSPSRPVARKNLHHLAVNAMDRPAFAVLLESLRVAAAEHVAALRANGSNNNHEAAATLAPPGVAPGADSGSSPGTAADAVDATAKTLAEYSGPVHAVAVQFPDPWARARHRRRRLAGPAVCSELAASPAVARGAWVYVSSDVPDCVAQAAAELTEHHFKWHRNGVAWPNASLVPKSKSISCASAGAAGTSGRTTTGPTGDENGGSEATAPPSLLTSFLGLWLNLPEGPAVDSEGLLLASPLGVGCGTEREAVCEQLWRKVYRILFVK